MQNYNRLLAKLYLGIEQLGLTITEVNAEKLMQYMQLLIKWNKVFNLTAITEPNEIITHHILDSLSIIAFLHGTRLLDVGSGAGFPGLPCALIKEQVQVVLLDSNGKKTRFLTQAAAELGIHNVEIVQNRIEKYQPAFCFDCITARAYSSIENILQVTKKLLCHDGELLIMKGAYPQAELQNLPNRAKVHRLIIPFLDERRHLVRIRVD